MSAFAGFVTFDRPLTGQETWPEAMAGRLQPPRPTKTLCRTETAWMAQTLSAETGENGDLVLAYDGELTNRPDLCRELGLPGDTPDREVIFAAYYRWGQTCAQQLRGAFAFAVYDPRSRRLLLARDGMGVKPLFYARRGNSLIFASTLPALLAHPQVPPEVDRQGLYELLLLGPGRTPSLGVFRGVYSLEPGQQAAFDREGLALGFHWSLQDAPWEGSFQQCAERVRALVEDSVQRQLDLPGEVCGFLSGGLDSSIICTLAAARLGALNTRSVDYRDNGAFFQPGGFQPEADGAYVALMRPTLPGEHKTVVLDTPELAEALAEAADARGLPGMADVDASLLLLCRHTAQEGYAAALSGECADEIFGGYPWYRTQALEGFPWAQNTALRAGYLRPEYLTWADPEEYVHSRYQQAVDRVDILPETGEDDRRIKRMMALNLNWFMQTLIDRNDRMGRAAGLGLRAPFCSEEIAQYLYTVPWRYKAYQGREKGLLRYAFQDKLPEEVAWRKKSPYPKTWNPSYRQAVTRLLQEELDRPDCPLKEFLRPEALLALLGEDRSVPWYGQLMTTPQTIAYFWQMAHWLRQFRVRLV